MVLFDWFKMVLSKAGFILALFEHDGIIVFSDGRWIYRLGQSLSQRNDSNHAKALSFKDYSQPFTYLIEKR